MCSVRPVLAVTVALGVFYLAFRKVIDHVLLIIGQFAMITVLTLLCLIIAWGIILIVRGIKRRRASEGGCLTCPYHCQGKVDNAADTILLPEMRSRDEKPGGMPNLPEFDAGNVTTLAAWKKRKKDPAVG